ENWIRKLEKKENREKKQRRGKTENLQPKHDHSHLGVGFHNSPRLGVSHTKTKIQAPKSMCPTQSLGVDSSKSAKLSSPKSRRET
ncbi:hypothetical protein PIB30_091671, partial [Stylosanthes scabra]|nr:hypothetical protein [Stylosanthes scabra]